eukprot:Lithocolla_globosa_v1_NODE_2580_length_1946_cov_20.866737.p2 type:complete len:141 gc:universal NODE_2580_length_1946_cov_20.866737:914-1336(+)
MTVRLVAACKIVSFLLPSTAILVWQMIGTGLLVVVSQACQVFRPLSEIVPSSAATLRQPVAFFWTVLTRSIPPSPSRGVTVPLRERRTSVWPRTQRLSDRLRITTRTTRLNKTKKLSCCLYQRICRPVRILAHVCTNLPP